MTRAPEGGNGRPPWEGLEARLAILEERIATLIHRVDKMDEERVWLVRLVLGVITAAVLGVVINKGGGLQ